MLHKLKKVVKSAPIIYKPLYFVKTKILYPIRSGHFTYYFKYTFSLKKKECAKLVSLGLDHPTPINFRDWRIGRGKDYAFRRYYLASFKGQKCFVKIGKNDATVRNEYETLSKISSETFNFSPKMLLGDANFEENTIMLAVQFVNGLSKFTLPDNKSDFEKMCNQFLNILEVLEAHKLVHADIHKGNLMLQGSKLYLLDYGISMFLDAGNSINYVARPGTFYRNVEDKRIYDDAYSFVKLIETLDSAYASENAEALQKIRDRIDKISFKVKI